MRSVCVGVYSYDVCRGVYSYEVCVGGCMDMRCVSQ